MFRFLLKKQKPTKLGRWSVEESMQVIERKIDMANCDSCGICEKKNLLRFYVIEGDVICLNNTYKKKKF